MATETAEAIHSYITDMLALELHIEKAIQAQVTAHEGDHPGAAAALEQMQATIEGHIAALRALDDGVNAGAGQAIGEAIKRVASSLAGFGAAAIDLVRNERLPKNLRDDATAFSLAATGYLMLHTTALALGHPATAALAARHLAAYAEMIMKVNHMVPEAVLDQLAADELPVDTTVAATALEAYRKAWSQ
jgi:ferritin-like metal-binding protein YciE